MPNDGVRVSGRGRMGSERSSFGDPKIDMRRLFYYKLGFPRSLAKWTQYCKGCNDTFLHVGEGQGPLYTREMARTAASVRGV